jgi:hypothetical protein
MTCPLPIGVAIMAARGPTLVSRTSGADTPDGPESGAAGAVRRSAGAAPLPFGLFCVGRPSRRGSEGHGDR